MDMDTHGEIKIVKLTGPGFEKCLAVHIKSDFSSLSTWELDGFHHSLYASGTWLNRWLDLRCSHGHSGYQRVLSLASQICPQLQVQLVPSMKTTAALKARKSLTIQGHGASQRTMVTIPFLLCYMIRTAFTNSFKLRAKAFNLLKVLAWITQQVPLVSIPLITGDTGQISILHKELCTCWHHESMSLSAEDTNFHGSWPAQFWTLSHVISHATSNLSSVKNLNPSQRFHFEAATKRVMQDSSVLVKCQFAVQDIIHHVSMCLDAWAFAKEPASIQEIVATRALAKSRKRTLSFIVPATLNQWSKRPKLAETEQATVARCNINSQDNILRGNLLHAKEFTKKLLGLGSCQMHLVQLT